MPPLAILAIADISGARGKISGCSFRVGAAPAMMVGNIGDRMITPRRRR